MGNVYLYFLKRNKKDVKILTTLQTEKTVTPTRLNNLSSLGLSNTDYLALNKVVGEHQLEWEIWIESADNYLQLRNSLQNRGFSPPPSVGSPIVKLKIKDSQFKTKQNTMTRRGH